MVLGNPIECLFLQRSSNYILQEKSIIKLRLTAALLLLVFAFSITPKKLLHDVFANHKDKVTISASDHSLQIYQSAFACKCDNLVAESPFTDQDNNFDFSAFYDFSEEQNLIPYHFYSSHYFFFELRGPPGTV
jgi:hypothetical protein